MAKGWVHRKAEDLMAKQDISHNDAISQAMSEHAQYMEAVQDLFSGRNKNENSRNLVAEALRLPDTPEYVTRYIADGFVEISYPNRLHNKSIAIIAPKGAPSKFYWHNFLACCVENKVRDGLPEKAAKMDVVSETGASVSAVAKAYTAYKKRETNS